MKPRTKKEIALVEVNKSVRELTDKETEWAYDKALFHKCRILKSYKATCLDCGHQWQANRGYAILKKIICPSCNQKLEVEHTRKVNFNDDNFVIYVQTHKEYQLTRAFKIVAYYKVGEPKSVYLMEKSRFYIDEKNMEQVFSCTRQSTWYGDSWGHDMALRHRGSLDKYLRYSKLIYKNKSVLKRIKRNGYKNNFYGWHPHYFFYSLLNSSIAETLLKTERKDFFDYLLNNINSNKIERFWPAIKLCIKNKYPIGKKSMDIYIDYLEELEFFGKDFRNIKYACPKDLYKEHNKFIERKRKLRLKIQKQKVIENMIKDEEWFKENKSKFFNLNFIKEELEIVPFTSVKQLLKESDLLRHCAFSSNYHTKKNSLMLSARYKSVIVETVEYDLINNKVLQSRGIFKNKANQATIHNKEIVKLVMSNKKEIIKANVKIYD